MIGSAMTRKIDWENQLGHRLRLKDLHVFFNVVECGSMAGAAAHLGCSQPAISEVISSLEHMLGVRLFDRSPRGVELTIYGRALLKGGRAAFDDLRQSIREIEFLADPTAGEVSIGCPESTATALFPTVTQQFHRQYPNAVVHLHRTITPTLELPELRARKIDMALARIGRPLRSEDDDLNVEILIDDHMVVAAGAHSPWASRPKIDLAELANETWILTERDSGNYNFVADAFRARGLDMPKICLTTYSIHLRAKLLAQGPYISAFPHSVFWLEAGQFSLKELPVKMPARSWSLGIVTVKNRTLSPIAHKFIEHLRAFTSSMAAGIKPNLNLLELKSAAALSRK
jgi:DNA-binding transcriptional LysR family regulator